MRANITAVCNCARQDELMGVTRMEHRIEINAHGDAQRYAAGQHMIRVIGVFAVAAAAIVLVVVTGFAFSH